MVSSHKGNALPERKTAETAASPGVRDFKYSATIAVFSSFLVVPAIRSQASASLCMWSPFLPQTEIEGILPQSTVSKIVLKLCNSVYLEPFQLPRMALRVWYS